MTSIQEDESLFLRNAIAAYRMHDEKGPPRRWMTLDDVLRAGSTEAHKNCGCFGRDAVLLIFTMSSIEAYIRHVISPLCFE